MQKSTNRIAIVDNAKCKPTKCNKECKKICPIERSGKECIEIETLAKISEINCVGCGGCVKSCPFGAIKIINIPSEINNCKICHRYGENGFRLYNLPIIKPNIITGMLGQNGIGKSTVMGILSNNIKPNFEIFDKQFTANEIIKNFKGTELQKYFQKLYNNELKISIKPQNIDSTLKTMKIKFGSITISKLINKLCENGKINKCNLVANLDKLEMTMLQHHLIETLSGGELQRLIIAITLSRDTNVFMFDEPTNYLDIRQRINVAKLIRSLINNEQDIIDKYVIVIDHDTSFLDYVTDQITLLFGEPGAYGIVSQPQYTNDAINTYFDGYIKSENIRFREYPFKLSELNSMTEMLLPNTNINHVNIVESQVNYDTFKLNINKFTINLDSSILIILGENGSGKTTLINKLINDIGINNISFKPQIISFDYFGQTVHKTVKNVLYDKIGSIIHNDAFKTDVIKPLQMEKLYDRYINELSGGEMQRVSIALCLGSESLLYVLDEPSACLDIEQRISITKQLKRFALNNHKTIIIVEHDIMMAVALAQHWNSNLIVVKPNKNKSTNEIKYCESSELLSFKEGINMFLKHLEITMRTDVTNNRPRINKEKSVKESDQIKMNMYYQ